jgi:hypothetical protein
MRKFLDSDSKKDGMSDRSSIPPDFVLTERKGSIGYSISEIQTSNKVARHAWLEVLVVRSIDEDRADILRVGQIAKTCEEIKIERAKRGFKAYGPILDHVAFDETIGSRVGVAITELIIAVISIVFANILHV